MITSGVWFQIYIPWSGLSGGNARLLSGHVFESAQKTRRLESRRCKRPAPRCVVPGSTSKSQIPDTISGATTPGEIDRGRRPRPYSLSPLLAGD